MFSGNSQKIIHLGKMLMFFFFSFFFFFRGIPAHAIPCRPGTSIGRHRHRECQDLKVPFSLGAAGRQIRDPHTSYSQLRCGVINQLSQNKLSTSNLSWPGLLAISCIDSNPLIRKCLEADLKKMTHDCVYRT